MKKILFVSSLFFMVSSFSLAEETKEGQRILTQEEYEREKELKHQEEGVKRIPPQGSCSYDNSLTGLFLKGLDSVFDMFRNCFESRERVPASRFEERASDVDEDYIANDKRTCECISRSPEMLEAEYNRTFKNTELEEDNLSFMILDANLKVKERRLQSMKDGMLVQAHLLNSTEKDEKEALDFLAKYNEEIGPETQRLMEDYKTFLTGKEFQLKSPKNKEEFRKKVAAIKLPAELSLKTLPSDELPKNPQGSCFSMRSYLAWEQRPNGKEFLEDLGEMTSFKSSDWNIGELKKQYDEAYRLFDSEREDVAKKSGLMLRVNALKDRIIFLKKNPLFANLFSAKSQDSETQQKLQRKKAELLKLLQDQYSSKGACAITEFKCVQKKHEARIQFDSKVRQLFKDDDILEATREELNRKIAEAYSESTDTVMNLTLPNTQPALEEKYKQMTGKSVNRCSKEVKGDDEYFTCMENFNLYCRLVDKVQSGDGKERMFTRPSDNLEEEIRPDLNLNPAENKGFIKATQDICLAPKKNEKGEVSTFAQYKKNKCAPAGKSSLPEECSDDRYLVGSFISEYHLSTDKVVIAEQHSNDAELALYSTNKAAKITEAKIAEVKKNTVAMSVIKKYGAKKAFANMSTTGPVAAPVFSGEEIKVPSAVTPSMVNSFLPMPSPSSIEDAALASLGTPNALAPLPTSSQAIPDQVNKTSHDMLDERKDLEAQLSQSRQELAEVKNKQAMEEAQRKVKSLEDLLEKKDEDYRRLLAAQDKKEGSLPAALGQKSKASAEADGPDSRSVSSKSQGVPLAASTGMEDGQLGRAPASIGDAGGFTQGNASGNLAMGSRAAISKVSPATTKLNAALLEKYGISVNGPTEGSILVAPEKDAKGLQMVSNALEGESVPLVVTTGQYEKFKVNDLETLKDIYEKKVKSLGGAVVKLSVRTHNQNDTLEFYAIREGDKVVFQPVRRNKLGDLKLMLPKT